MGWPAAAAFAGDTAWQLLVPRRRLTAAQVVLIGISGSAVVAQGKAAESEAAGEARGAERVVVALPLSLLAGWTIAATAISLHDAAVDADRTPRRVQEATAAATLLSVGGLAAARVAVTGGRGSVSGGGYAAAVLWALAGVAIEQRKRSRVVSGAAVAAAAPVAAALRR